MSTKILRIVSNDIQFFSASKDGSMTNYSPAKIQFIYELIRENAKFDGDGAHLFACDLSEIDSKLLLSYVLDIEDYEHYCNSPELLKIAIKEFRSEMQELIDQYKDQVWHDDMQEMGAHLCTHADNGEIYYVK